MYNPHTHGKEKKKKEKERNEGDFLWDMYSSRIHAHVDWSNWPTKQHILYAPHTHPLIPSSPHPPLHSTPPSSSSILSSLTFFHLPLVTLGTGPFMAMPSHPQYMHRNIRILVLAGLDAVLECITRTSPPIQMQHGGRQDTQDSPDEQRAEQATRPCIDMYLNCCHRNCFL